jgi:hypothetical protein
MTAMERGNHMTGARWLFLGAILLAIGIALYLIFFCPTECH